VKMDMVPTKKASKKPSNKGSSSGKKVSTKVSPFATKGKPMPPPKKKNQANEAQVSATAGSVSVRLRKK